MNKVETYKFISEVFPYKLAAKMAIDINSVSQEEANIFIDFSKRCVDQNRELMNAVDNLRRNFMIDNQEIEFLMMGE